MNRQSPLGDNITVETFLQEYWQKRPLLIKSALPDFHCPVTAEELAGLACEEGVESRLIQEHGKGGGWQVRNGPFSEEDFLALPDSHWTVLVQEINKQIPEFALLLERFRFIPNWRLDDVMVSFAPDQGTVGPHADNYDVFLIQGPGKRRWQLSYQDAGPEQLIPGLPLRVLKDFRPEEEYILEEGDMLYLPPGVVHQGVALEECITISVGFRAPAKVELLSGYLADVLAQMDPEAFYEDPDLQPQRNPGQISEQARERIRGIIRSVPLDDERIDRWFGSFTTDVRPGHYLPEPEESLDAAQLVAAIREAGELWRSEYARFAYIDDDPVQIRLYVAGEEFTLGRHLDFAAPLLCGQRIYTPEELDPYLINEEFVALLVELYRLGAVYLPE
ncbi:MAG: cupin domain-containing protein [Gammaproteobacteria bacterium]|nr:cupin domain-containing protein [Gammaproteobacteria bacterium]MCW8957514.1 cupin domain-containing protein [Gammaproteobacteria bacterium]MCW8973426.1 cupin domain-containing protein [Gammaproteobacteria bacterium]MCW8992266.1 cupin domain-containing protein [Gammaproteobacteria bacterium]